MKENAFLVIGLGTFGRELCIELAQKGANVIAVDNRIEMIEKVKGIAAQTLLLDSTDELYLSKLPIENVEMAIIAIGDNIESNILTTALLKKAGIPYIISRASSELHHSVLKQVGANEVLDIEKTAGQQLAEKIISPEILDSVPLTMKISIAEVYLPETFAGKTVAEVDLQKKMNLKITAIKRDNVSIDENGSTINEENVIFPNTETVFEEGDVLIVIGRNDDIEEIRGI
ncbi:MAG: TrkA family potassium uptake protein [Spirochaetales bacterium]|nr:TrkA family potassium uptake protein [Spirochaetales bacterium]